ncbi:MAG: META domain-containing protein [Methanotrichaceae archaeon]|nr:META domain-containing protein [Methanotrichaceae archaeon]
MKSTIKELCGKNAGILLSLVVLIILVCEGGAVEKTIYVGPKQMDCVGVAPQKCLQAKEKSSEPYELFYDRIEGFCYQEGYNYVILVDETTVPNPPADASNNKWKLISVLSKMDSSGKSTAMNLENVSWSLDYYLNGQGETTCVLPSAGITARFEAGCVVGKAGCNNYFANYKATNGSLTIGLIASTMMMCSDEIMTQESCYLADLGRAANYNVLGGLLKISDDNDTLLLTYSEELVPSFINKTWMMTSYNNGKGGLVSSLQGTKVTAFFDDNGHVSGSAVCNQYSGTYQLNRSALELIGPLATTLKYCIQPEGIMDQEQEYLAALQSSASFEIEDRVLTIFDMNKTRMVTYGEEILS